MSGRKAAWLSARREIRERMRSRAFRISTLVQVAAVIVVAIVISLTGGSDQTTVKVGFLDERGQQILRGAEAAAPALEIEIEASRYANRDESRVAIEEGEIDAAVGPGPVLVASDAPDEIKALLPEAASTVALRSALAEAGIPAGRGAALLAESRVPLETVSDQNGSDGGGIAFIATLLLYVALIFCGYAVAGGVVEEKSTRVVELIINAIKPRELLAGKVFGIGLMGLAQLLLTVVAGLGSALLLGEIELPAATAETALLSLLYFVLGFGLYGCAFAVAGSMVSRQEDSNTTTAPIMIVLVAAYILSISAASEPSSTLAVIGTLVPVTAPIMTPARAATGELPPEQLIASVLLLIASCALLIWIAGRVYEQTVLRMGAPVNPREILRVFRAR